MSADPRGKFWWEEAQWSWPVSITTCSSANLQTSDHVSILSASILGEDGSSCVRRLPEPWPSLASTWKSSETNTLTDSARFCFLWVYVLGPRRSEREAALLSWGWGGVTHLPCGSHGFWGWYNKNLLKNGLTALSSHTPLVCFLSLSSLLNSTLHLFSSYFSQVQVFGNITLSLDFLTSELHEFGQRWAAVPDFI